LKRNETALTLPSFLWLLVFFAVPALIVVITSFRSADAYGGILKVWTLSSYKSLGLSKYAAVTVRTLRLSLLTTLITILISFPCSYAMARLPVRSQQNVLLLLIVPFWTNFLIRIYAWKVILHPDGALKALLVALRLVSPDASLLYNEGAVLLVLVYTYLPFALLPMYSAAEGFDYSLLEAARDLGASGFRVLTRVYIPGIRSGILSALLVVFIPALGSYIIPEVVGGTNSEMLGNKIAQYVFVDRNLPRAGALSSIMLLVILIPSFVSLSRSRHLKGDGGLGGGLTL